MKLMNLAAMMLLLVAGAHAQTMPAASTQPTTRPRYQLVAPNGFQIVSVSFRKAVCEPSDEAWVKDVLEKTPAPTKPTTMPEDLAQSVLSRRAEFTSLVMADLALSDKAAVDEMFDQHLLPSLKKLGELEPPIFYLVTTPEKLKDVVKAGWQNPRFYYNRAADAVAFGRLQIGIEMDDQAVDVLYPAGADEPARREVLTKAVTKIEGDVGQALSNEGPAYVQMAVARLVDEAAFKDIDFKPGQEWFGLGARSLMTYKHSSMLSDMPYAPDKLAENPRNPIRENSINLLHPTNLKDLRENAVPYYVAAVQNRATRVIYGWYSKAPAGSLPKVLGAIKSQKPADGEALVKIINEISGIDLTAELKAR